MAKAPALIVVAGLVLAVIEPFVMSVEVKVAVPAVFAVTEKRLGAGDERGVGRERRVGVGGGDADGVGGADRVPVGVDGVDDDVEGAAGGLRRGRAGLAGGGARGGGLPGSRICSFAKAPPLIVVAGLVFAVIAPFVMSVAVKVFEPAVFGVTESVFVPATSAVFAGRRRVGVGGRDADGVGGATTFQFASTALTVTLKEPPAVCADGVPVLPVAVPGAAVSPGAGSAAS